MSSDVFDQGLTDIAHALFSQNYTHDSTLTSSTPMMFYMDVSELSVIGAAEIMGTNTKFNLEGVYRINFPNKLILKIFAAP